MLDSTRTTTAATLGKRAVAVLITVVAALALMSLTPDTAQAASGIKVEPFSGGDRYDTSYLQAKAAFPEGCNTAVLVSGDDGKWADALSASSLAGAINCPILLTKRDELPKYTQNALTELKVKQVVIIGGTDCVSDKLANETLPHKGISVIMRLAGKDRYQTQSRIFRYGQEKGYWNSQGRAFMATGAKPADALSASPVAYALKMPVFLADDKHDGKDAFTSEQQDDLKSLKDFVVLGGTDAVTEDVVGYLQGIGTAKTRLDGANRNETSVNIASWTVREYGFTWEHAGFARGGSTHNEKPYDALAGGPLQGKTKSVMLLVNTPTDKTVQSIGGHKGDFKNDIRIFGGSAAVPVDVRTTIYHKLGIADYYIMGKSTVNASQMAKCYNAVVAQNASHGWKYPVAIEGKGGAKTIDDFCKILLEEANAEGVRAEVLFAQVMHETGWLQYGGLAKPEWYNYGGLGVTGASDAKGQPLGNKFKDVRTGLRAQVQHLKAYASKDALKQGCVDERFKYVKRGCAPTVQLLSGKWAVPGIDADGTTYGDSLYKYIMQVKGM